MNIYAFDTCVFALNIRYGTLCKIKVSKNKLKIMPYFPSYIYNIGDGLEFMTTLNIKFYKVSAKYKTGVD
jgi:hypothetical protein